MYFYKAYDLTVRSEVFLPDFLSTPESHPDINITLDRIDIPRDVKAIHGVSFKYLDNGLFWRWEQVGSFVITNGNHIRIEPVTNCSNSQIQQVLYGTALGAILQQRSALVLHGSAICAKNNAIVILGDQFAGKSSLTAACMQAGYSILTDDVTGVTLHKNSSFVSPGVPIIKLWPDTVKTLNLQEDRLEPLNLQTKKYLYKCQDKFCSTRCNLTAIIVLSISSTYSFSPIIGKEKLLRIISNNYFSASRANQLISAQQFFNSRKLAETTPLFLFSRPHEIKRLSESAEILRKNIDNSLSLS